MPCLKRFVPRFTSEGRWALQSTTCVRWQCRRCSSWPGTYTAGENVRKTAHGR